MKLTLFNFKTLQTTAFISHMVQMKPAAITFGMTFLTTFISHMVQMKLVCLVSIWGINTPIYIPHGSDETNKTWKKNKFNIIIYIPHGSDETRIIRLEERID